MNDRNTVILEVNSQNREVPIYKCFEDAKEGYCVLLGNNKKSLNLSWLRDKGKIEDGNGVVVEYAPYLSVSNSEEYIKRLEKASALPKGSSIWLVGKFTPGRKTWHGQTPSRITTYDIGEKEEFVRPDLLE